MRIPDGAVRLRVHQLSLIFLAAGFSTGALAQSTGSEIVDDSMTEVVVTGTRVRGVGILTENTAAKSRVSLAGDYLDTQTAGQSVFQSLNQIPGVNFTNSDPFGTSGGNLRIRGFDGSRVSVTFDGIPLNDSGNYALYTNQMLDSELIERVDVNLGTTDVDSPTASATGGTVAYKTRRPTQEFGGQTTLSFGDNNYRRAFLRLDSGEFGPWATKAFIAASYQNYDKFKGPGELEKKQVNAVVRQDFDNGNFISLGMHFNVNRNAFYRATNAANFARYGRDYDNLDVCTRDAPTPGVADNDNATPEPSVPGGLQSGDNPANSSSCSNYYGVRINPSDTGNIRMQSLWHLGEGLRLTFDPSWQYTLANGGGSTALAETRSPSSPDTRVLGASTTATGVDLNGDGDLLDTVRFYTPNTTNTRRWGATTSLIWDVNDDHRLRFAYTWDRARHRQTGMWGPLDENGNPENVFAGRQGERVYAADGEIIRGRDRFSIAKLEQYALEWRGQFAEDRLTATLGLRAPFFTRELNQYCYTPNGGSGSSGTIGNRGGALCTARAPLSTLPNGSVTFAPGATPVQFIPPYSETVKFDDLLPNAGLTFKPWDRHMFYLSYAEGLSAPRTDNLYAVARDPDSGAVIRPTPESETTKAYDLGWRLNGGAMIASFAIYQIDYRNRIVSTFNADLGYSEDRNVGDVQVRGFDAQLGRSFTDRFSLTGSVSYNDSELAGSLDPALNGMQLVETPEWTFAARAEYQPLETLRLALQAKRVGDRFATDNNDEVAPSYTVVDLDASYSFKLPGLESAQVQLNVTNLLDEEYFGNISSGTGGSSVAFYSIGAPRTVSASFKFNF